ncbi:hypothetical protein [Microseira sp. BLCC-F43]|jgi:hypothetical protein|uniref:hypothetical protein n=1 Tax=Microseira sp. BLCC-F43 TaxID=3153602 RepID=UPI0035BB5510
MAQDINELSIVLAIRNHTPAILTLDFLQSGGIVPADWELQRPVVLTATSAQVAFKNGINIVGNTQTVTFSEPIGKDALEKIEIAKVAGNYVSTLPNLDYQAVGINPRTFATFENQPDRARKFINDLFYPASWQNIGTAPMQESVELAYTLPGRQLRLSIAEAGLRLSNNKEMPAVMFAGNFHYDLTGEEAERRVRALQQLLTNWQADLAVYREIVHQNFLAKNSGTDVLLIRDAS